MRKLKAALLGRSLAHSISPELHQELWKILGKRARSTWSEIEYDKIECANERECKEWILSAASKGYDGCNITAPFKSVAFETATTALGNTQDIASGNTIQFKNGEIVIASSDGAGYLSALKREIPSIDLTGYHIVVLGAGDAAKAVSYALLQQWMPLSFTIVSRDMDRGNALLAMLLAAQPGPSVALMPWSELANFPREMNERYFVVQCTTVGQKNGVTEEVPFPWSGIDVASELIYNPLETEFLKRAKEQNAKAVSGLGMLIEQAAISQQFWIAGEFKPVSPLTEDQYQALKNTFSKILT